MTSSPSAIGPPRQAPLGIGACGSRSGGQTAVCSCFPVMLPASSLTIPTTWRTSSEFQPRSPSPPLARRVDCPPGWDPVQTEGPNHLGRRARSVPQQTTHPNLATQPDILALLQGIIPQAFAGGMHRTQVTSALPTGTAPPQTQPKRTNLRRSPRTKSETGHSLRNFLPPGLPRSQSTGTSLICDKDHASQGAQGNGRLPRTCPMTSGDEERRLEDAASRWRMVMPLGRPCLEEILWKSSSEDPSVSTKAHTSQGRCPHSR